MHSKCDQLSGTTTTGNPKLYTTYRYPTRSTDEEVGKVYADFRPSTHRVVRSGLDAKMDPALLRLALHFDTDDLHAVVRVLLLFLRWYEIMQIVA